MKNKNILVSIAIPAYDGNDGGVENLTYLLDSILQQDYPHIEVIVSDHSLCHKKIKGLVEDYKTSLNIQYHQMLEDRGYWGSNLNNAMHHCNGDIVKPMLQDDFFRIENCISLIVEEFDKNPYDWAVCAGVLTDRERLKYYNVVIPKYNPDIYRGNNTIGGPSCLAIRNTDKMLRFEPRLNWMGDCDYYKRSYDLLGLPNVISTVCVVYRMWSGQMTNTLTDEQKHVELNYVSNKFIKTNE